MVKTGDEVLVIAGKDKGKRGKIKQSLPPRSRVVVEGLNMIKRHMKPRGPGKPGGIIEMEAPLHVSNVMLICPSCGRAAAPAPLPRGDRPQGPPAEGPLLQGLRGGRGQVGPRKARRGEARTLERPTYLGSAAP